MNELELKYGCNAKTQKSDHQTSHHLIFHTIAIFPSQIFHTVS